MVTVTRANSAVNVKPAAVISPNHNHHICFYGAEPGTITDFISADIISASFYGNIRPGSRDSTRVGRA